MVASASASRSRMGFVAIVLALIVVGAVLSSRPAGAQVDVHVFWPVDSIRNRFQDFGDEAFAWEIGSRVVARYLTRHNRVRTASHIRIA